MPNKEIYDEATREMISGESGATLINTYFCNISSHRSKGFRPAPNTRQSTTSIAPTLEDKGYWAQALHFILTTVCLQYQILQVSQVGIS